MSADVKKSAAKPRPQTTPFNLEPSDDIPCILYAQSSRTEGGCQMTRMGR